MCSAGTKYNAIQKGVTNNTSNKNGIRQQRMKPQVLVPLLRVVMMDAMIYPIITPMGTDACNLPIHDVTLPLTSK